MSEQGKNIILVPVDFSDHAINAAHFAAGLARDLGLEVRLLHAYAERPLGPVLSAKDSGSIEEGEAAINLNPKETAEQKMADLGEALKQKSGDDLIIRKTIVRDDVHDAVKHYSDEQETVLVCFGVRHYNRAYRVLIGSTASNLIESSNRPILAVPIDAQYQGIRSLVFATDFERNDGAAVQQVEGLLEKLNPTVKFIHLIVELAQPYEEDQLEALRAEILTHVQEQTGKLNVSVDLIGGNHLLTTLDRYLDKNNIDALAFVTQKRNFFFRLFYPSITKQMMFITHKPMLILHAD